MSVETTWLRAHVRECLRDIWSVCGIRSDEDDDVPFRAGTSAGWVMVVLGEPPLLRVLLQAAYDVKPTAAVLREINDVNHRARTVKVSIVDGLVLVEQCILASAVDATPCSTRSTPSAASRATSGRCSRWSTAAGRRARPRTRPTAPRRPDRSSPLSGDDR